MFERCFHFSRRIAWVAGILVASGTAGGCAHWNSDRWNINQLRDERAVDVERRLERIEPIVKNPF